MTTKAEATANVKLWLDALENGDLLQTTGALENVDSNWDNEKDDYLEGESQGFCCLGVACKVLGAKRKFDSGVITYDGEDGLLPDTIRKKLGLKGTDPSFKVVRDYDGTVLERIPTEKELADDAEEAVFDVSAVSLSTLNDDDGLSFREIAKQIRLHKNEIFRYKDMDI